MLVINSVFFVGVCFDENITVLHHGNPARVICFPVTRESKNSDALKL